MNTLFDDSKYIVKPRSTDGTFCTTRNFKTIQRLRMCITGEVRRRDCFSKQLRQRDEEIIKLKAENAKLLSKLRKFAEQDKLDNLF